MTSATAREQVRSDAIGDPYLTLVEILAGAVALRLTDDIDPVTYGGVAYQPWPVRLVLGARGADRQPSAAVEVSNVSQAAASALRAISEPPVCNIRIARCAKAEYVTFEGEIVTFQGEPVTFGGPAGAFGVRSIELALLNLRIVSVEFSAQTAACRLGPEWDWSRERFPPLRHDGRFRGLWA